MSDLGDSIICRACGNLAYLEGEVDGAEPGEITRVYRCEACQRKEGVKRGKVRHEEGR